MTRMTLKSRSLQQGQIKVANLQSQTYPYQVSSSHTLGFPRYGPYEMLKVKATTKRTKVKSVLHHDVTQPNQSPYQVLTSYTLKFLKYSLDRMVKIKVKTAKSKVKSSSDYHLYNLHLPAKVPIKYHHPTPHGF